MKEKDFAKMTEKELRDYCAKLKQELFTAEWFLRNKIQSREELKNK